MEKIAKKILMIVSLLIFGILNVSATVIPDSRKREAVAYRYSVNGTIIKTEPCNAITQKEIEQEFELPSIDKLVTTPGYSSEYSLLINRIHVADSYDLFFSGRYEHSFSFDDDTFEMSIKGDVYTEVQYLTKSGDWGVPYIQAIPIDDKVYGDIVDISNQGESQINVPDGIKVNVVKFVSDGKEYDVQTSTKALIMEIYDIDNNLIQTFWPYQLNDGVVITFGIGIYYIAIYPLAKYEGVKYFYPSDYSFGIMGKTAQCKKPDIYYNGRYVELKSNEEDSNAEIYYSISSGRAGNVADGTLIDLEGLNEISVVGKSVGLLDSEVVTFTPKYYANDSDVFTTYVGQFESAYEWLLKQDRDGDGEADGYGGCKDFESLTVHGPLDENDFACMSGFYNLRKLDLKYMNRFSIPQGAFFNMDNMEYLIMPETVVTNHGDLFKDNSRLSAIRFTSPTETVMPSGMLNGIENPNLLLYVRFDDYAREVEDKFPNVILGVDKGDGVVVAGEAKSKIQLYDGYPFYCPIEFSAKEAEFTREFNKTTELFGGCAGWELMTLPFRAHGFNHAEKGSIYSFADGRVPSTNDYSRKFWLYYRGAAGPDFIPEWVGAESMEPNAPYLVAMPNNELYYDEYNLNGTVTFIGTGVFVPVTPEEMSIDFGNGDRLVATYRPVAMTDRMMAINDEDYYSDGKNYLPGSCFLGKTFQSRDIRPFECYLLTEDANRRAMPIFDTSSVEKLFGDNNLKVWSEGHDIVILSAKKTVIGVYDMAGRCVRTATAVAGEETRLTDFAPGVYFIGGKKLLIK